tara:strand:- start:39 stop:728 length:690 start_codon:yes stop_codon:yes gene_type:complete
LEVTTLAIVGLKARDFLPALRGEEAVKAVDFLPASRVALKAHDSNLSPAGAEFHRKYASRGPMGVKKWMRGDSGLSYGSHAISSPSRFDVGLTAEQHEKLMTAPFPFAHHRVDSRSAGEDREEREDYGAHGTFIGAFSGVKDPENHKLALFHHYDMATAHGRGTPEGDWHHNMYSAHLHAGKVAGTSTAFGMPRQPLSRGEQVFHKRQSGRYIRAANSIFDKHFGQGAS